MLGGLLSEMREVIRSMNASAMLPPLLLLPTAKNVTGTLVAKPTVYWMSRLYKLRGRLVRTIESSLWMLMTYSFEGTHARGRTVVDAIDAEVGVRNVRSELVEEYLRNS